MSMYSLYRINMHSQQVHCRELALAHNRTLIQHPDSSIHMYKCVFYKHTHSISLHHVPPLQSDGYLYLFLVILLVTKCVAHYHDRFSSCSIRCHVREVIRCSYSPSHSRVCHSQTTRNYDMFINKFIHLSVFFFLL